MKMNETERNEMKNRISERCFQELSDLARDVIYEVGELAQFSPKSSRLNLSELLCKDGGVRTKWQYDAAMTRFNSTLYNTKHTVGIISGLLNEMCESIDDDYDSIPDGPDREEGEAISRRIRTELRYFKRPLEMMLGIYFDYIEAATIANQFGRIDRGGLSDEVPEKDARPSQLRSKSFEAECRLYGHNGIEF